MNPDLKGKIDSKQEPVGPDTESELESANPWFCY